MGLSLYFCPQKCSFELKFWLIECVGEGDPEMGKKKEVTMGRLCFVQSVTCDAEENRCSALFYKL